MIPSILQKPSRNLTRHLRSFSKNSKIPCTLIPGDGVGPELVNSVQEIFKAADVPITFEKHVFSEVKLEKSEPLDVLVASIKKNKVCLNGVLTTPDARYTGDLEPMNMKLRRALNLYANVVHIKSWVKTRHDGVNFIVVREQTEAEYSALEHESVKGIVECLKIVTREKSLRIAKFAFDYAMKHKRKKVTCVHKANIMKLTDGLFLRSCQEMAELYPRIEFDNMIVDNCTMQLCLNPQQFDVLVTPNLYGNLINNLGAGLVGGAGIVPGAIYSDKCVLFEPGARHTFATAAGKNVANPTAMILCGINMLTHVNLLKHSLIIRQAVDKVIKDGKVKTKDLGGNATTQEFTSAVISNLKDK